MDGSTTDGTPCTLVYPAEFGDGTKVYKDDFSGVKDAATLLAAAHPCLNIDLFPALLHLPLSVRQLQAPDARFSCTWGFTFFLHLALLFLSPTPLRLPKGRRFLPKSA